MQLPVLIALPLSGALLSLIFKKHQSSALFTSLLTFIYALYLWTQMDFSTSQFHYLTYLPWLSQVRLGLDGLAISLILLTTFLIPICLLIGWNQTPLYSFLFLFIEGMLLALFST